MIYFDIGKTFRKETLIPKIFSNISQEVFQNTKPNLTWTFDDHSYGHEYWSQMKSIFCKTHIAIFFPRELIKCAFSIDYSDRISFHKTHNKNFSIFHEY